MKDVNGEEIKVCPGETRKAPGQLRREAQRLRIKADLLDKLADQTDGTLCEMADNMLFALIYNSK